MALQRIDHPRHLRPADGRVPAGQRGYKLADDGNRYKDGKKMESLRLLVYDEPGSTARTNAANKIVDQLAAVGIPAYVATWSRESVQTKLVSGDYSSACAASISTCPPTPASH